MISPYATLCTLPMGSVQLSSGFWVPRLSMLQEVTLPTQYEILEETGRIDNFRRAAGKINQDFKGRYYNDSDVYKWLEGAILSLAIQKSHRIESLVDKVIDEIIAAQGSDGYLNTYFTFERKRERWTDIANKHELYCAGHLIQAAIAHQRVTGSDRFLRVALRFADHIYNIFGDEKRAAAPGHPEIEMALTELYRLTGDQRYLRLAQWFLDNRGKGLVDGTVYHIDHLPFRELPEIVGHAVMSLYLNSGATDVYGETGDETLLNALKRLWDNMVSKKMYITGGVGARHEGESFGDDYELPNCRAYAETCAAIANVMWNWRMLLISGEAKFVDVLEVALYNGALAGISLSGREYFYVNPLADRGGHRRQDWFDCACCPTNIVRLLASVPHYLYSQSSAGIWVHTYAGNTAKFNFKGMNIRIEERTRYPWDGDIELTVYPEEETMFALFVRIPGWCDEPTVRVNGRVVSEDVVPGSYLCIERSWQAGDTIQITLPMPIQKIIAHPWVRENAGRVALKRGPIVYCLEQDDHPDCDVWNIALPLDAELRSEWDPDLLGGVMLLRGMGLALDRSKWEGRLYSAESIAESTTTSVMVTAIPYYSWANRSSGPMTVWIETA